MSEPETPPTPSGPTPEQIQHITDSFEAFKASADQAHAELSQLRANHALVMVKLQRAQQEKTALTATVAELRAKCDALAVDKAGLEQRLAEATELLEAHKSMQALQVLAREPLPFVPAPEATSSQ
jgi:DNA repair exonuclease SbcCD ATPase subunit